MNDPNTGQFMWGDVIQDLIRNYMMMQMMKGGKRKFGVDTPTPAPHATEPDLQQKAPGSMQSRPFPGGNNQSAQLPPQLMQMLMQLLQQSQMQSPMRG